MPVSPDGATITAPTAQTLVTADGTWSFGGVAPPWGSDILLNGAFSGGQAAVLKVTNGGQLYAQNSAGTWYVYRNGGYVATDDPTPPPVGTPVVGSNAGIMWGVNIHAGRGGVYNTLGGNATMALVASLGLKIVRTDLYTASAQDQAILTAALASAATAGTKVMPILMADINPAITSYADETAAYNAGHAMGLTYGTNFKGQVSVWEIGNEWNGKMGAVANAGALATDYDATNLAKVRGLARGLIEGLKVGDPACKVSFGSTSALSHWGWTDALYAAGVRWDITSVHYYDNGTFDITALPLVVGTTDLLALMHSKYNVPSWITEWNYYPPGTAQATEAAYLTNIMPVWDGFAKSKFLEGVFIYELLEEGDGFGIASGTGGLLPESTAIKTYLAAHPSIIYKGPPGDAGSGGGSSGATYNINITGGNMPLPTNENDFATLLQQGADQGFVQTFDPRTRLTLTKTITIQNQNPNGSPWGASGGYAKLNWAGPDGADMIVYKGVNGKPNTCLVFEKFFMFGNGYAAAGAGVCLKLSAPDGDPGAIYKFTLRDIYTSWATNGVVIEGAVFEGLAENIHAENHKSDGIVTRSIGGAIMSNVMVIAPNSSRNFGAGVNAGNSTNIIMGSFILNGDAGVRADNGLRVGAFCNGENTGEALYKIAGPGYGTFLIGNEASTEGAVVCRQYVGVSAQYPDGWKAMGLPMRYVLEGINAATPGLVEFGNHVSLYGTALSLPAGTVRTIK